MGLYVIAQIYEVYTDIEKYKLTLESGNTTEWSIISKLTTSSECELIGYRILNTKNMTYMDATYESIKDYLRKGNNIDGIILTESGEMSYIYYMDNEYSREKSVILPTIIKELDYKPTGNELWIAVGKSDTGLLLINRFGKTQAITHEFIQNHELWAGRILNISMGMLIGRINNEAIDKDRDDIMLDKNIGELDIEFDNADSVNKLQLKMNALGMTDGYYLDDAGEIIVKDSKKVSAVIIPHTATVIRPKTFEYCSNLTRVKITKNIGLIGYEAFEYCSSLEEIEIPGNVKIIGDYAFQRCGSLSKVTLNEGIEQLGYRVFDQCKALKEIKLPKTLKGELDLTEIFGYSEITVQVPIELKNNLKGLANKYITIEYYS